MAHGIDTEQIKGWLADGRLQAVHRGVYAVGHVAPSMQGDYGDVVENGAATIAELRQLLSRARSWPTWLAPRA